jgi:CheY-like chemotaxis protein
MNAPVTILVVDDNPAMAKTLMDILVLKGYPVHLANSGARALEILASVKVDILLTDVVMPEMNGVELLRAAVMVQPRLIIFLMTAYTADDLLNQGIKAGAKAVLTKPIDIELFLSLVTATAHAYINKEMK